VSPKEDKHLCATCRCGNVEFEAIGPPIATGACYCASCQEAGRQFEQLPGVERFLDHYGGTEFILCRKDRVRCVKGQDHLAEHRLTPQSPTRRVVATCCNAPMFLDFTKGHWLTMYRKYFRDPPPLEMRVMTKDRRAGIELPADIPNINGHSGKFFWKLIIAWTAMGFRTPKIFWGTPGRGAP
jgi:hypothetical protein